MQTMQAHPKKSTAALARDMVPDAPVSTTAHDVATALGKDYQTVHSALTRAADKGTDGIKQIDRGAFTKVPAGTYTVSPSAPSVAEPMVTYPVAPHGHGAAKTGRDNEDGEPREATLPEALMRRWTGGPLPARGFWTLAAGTSAEPHIPNGSPVFVEETSEIVEGERYAIWLGEAEADVIKRVSIGASGAVTLMADNRNVPPRTLYPTDEDGELWAETPHGANRPTLRFRIRGRVVIPSDAPAATTAYVASQVAEVAAAIVKAIR